MKWKLHPLLFVLGAIAYIIFLLWLENINYYLFHLITEISTFMISFTVVIFVLLTPKGIKSTFIKIVAIGMFFSSVIMIIHMLLYEDFGILSQYSVNESLQFWILGNLVLAVSILTAVVSKIKHVNVPLYGFTLPIILILFSVLIFNGSLPLFYIIEKGQTGIKITLEIVIILVYISSLTISYLTKTKYRDTFFLDFFISVLLLITAEILFTQYFVITEYINPVAHVIKFMGLYILMIGTINEFIISPIDENLLDLSSEIDSLKEQFIKVERNSDIFKSLYAESPIGYQSLNINGEFITVNKTYARMLGYEVNEMIGKKFASFMTPRSQEIVRTRFKEFIENGSVDTIFEMVHKNGSIITVRFLGKIAYRKNGDFKQTHCILVDISNEIVYQKGLVDSKKKLEGIIENSQRGVLIIDENHICLYANKKALEILKYFEKSELIDKNIHDLLHNHDEYKINSDYTFNDFMQTLSDPIESDENAETTFYNKNKVPVQVMYGVEHFNIGSKKHKIITFQDKLLRDSSIDKLINLSYYDVLTGIYNRRYYEEEIINIDNENNYPLSIIVADINGLKLINDAFGHTVGDELIQSSVDVFVKFAKKGDLIARIGGDEFIIVMPKTSKAKAEKRVSDMINETKETDNKYVNLSISFGINTKESKNEDYNEIYKTAEDRMYRMKLLDVPSMRSNTINTIINTLYEKDQYSEAHSRSVSKLSEAIARHLELPYQQIKETQVAGLLHDIGKIVVSKSILNKNGKLTDQEYGEIKHHSEIGYRILNSTKELRHLAEIVLSHHEKFDGTGYPQNLSGEKIPLISRIICVADAFDAMTSERTYRNRLTDEDALVELIRCSGTQFDPKIVEVLKQNFNDILSFENI